MYKKYINDIVKFCEYTEQTVLDYPCFLVTDAFLSIISQCIQYQILPFNYEHFIPRSQSGAFKSSPC